MHKVHKVCELSLYGVLIFFIKRMEESDDHVKRRLNLMM